jgi:hypothetical protein
MDHARTMLAKTAPGNRSEPVVGEPRRVPSTETLNQQEYLQAQRRSQGDFGSVAPIVSPNQIAETIEPVNNANEPAPFNYQLAAKSFTRMADPFELQPKVSPEVPPQFVPTLPQTQSSVAQSDDPMLQVLASSDQQGEISIGDANVSPASYIVPSEPAPQRQLPSQTKALRMPTLIPPRVRDLVPPTPMGT